MTRDEAHRRCSELAVEQPDWAWFPRRAPDGRWGVARLPRARRPRPAPSTEAHPRPPLPDDPRPASTQLVPPYGPGTA